MIAAPRERPIPFISEMVLAILAGRKTETRRLVKGAWPTAAAVHALSGGGARPYAWLNQRDGTWRLVGDVWAAKQAAGLSPDAPQPVIKAPYRLGDLLWVRERVTRSGGLVQYLADSVTSRHLWPAHWKNDPQAARFMPKRFARIWLRVLEVRVERLQEIAEESYFAEGLRMPPVEETVGHGGDLMIDVTGWWKTAFAGAWDRLNGDRAPWKSNPWVWVNRFEVVEGGSNVKGEQG